MTGIDLLFQMRSLGLDYEGHPDDGLCLIGDRCARQCEAVPLTIWSNLSRSRSCGGGVRQGPANAGPGWTTAHKVRTYLDLTLDEDAPQGVEI